MMPAKYFDYWKGFAGHGSYFYKDAKENPIHETAMMGKQMEEFISSRDTTKPFCLSVSFKAPHSEDGVAENNGFRPDPFFNNWYTDTHFRYPATYADSFYMQFPAPWRVDELAKENEARVRWKMRFGTPDKLQTTYRAIYRLVSGIDRVVGNLRQYLEQQGLAGNTIIVFASDNGYYMGEHGLEGKWYGHRESIEIPLLIYNPQEPSHMKQVDELVLNLDLAPTLLQWAGLPQNRHMQGASLVPLVQGKKTKWRSHFFYEHTYNPGTYPVYIPHTVGIVNKSYAYMRYYNGSNSQHAIFETLYQTYIDSLEVNNLIAKPVFSRQINRMRALVQHYEKVLR